MAHDQTPTTGPVRRPAFFLLSGIAIGILGWAALRFLFAPCPHPPHYHANWLVMVNGEKVDLSAERYMEEIGSCTATDAGAPQRVHMHEGIDHVVHVHAAGVTWGHLLDNLGLDAAPDRFVLDDGRRYVGGQGGTLTYIVNGHVVDRIRERPIRSGDRLLISYGPAGAEAALREEFPQVPADAEEYNQRDDPATCSGAVHDTFGDRLAGAFWRCSR